MLAGRWTEGDCLLPSDRRASPARLAGPRPAFRQRCPRQSPASGQLSRTHGARAFLGVSIQLASRPGPSRPRSHTRTHARAHKDKMGKGQNLQLVLLEAPHPAVLGPRASAGPALGEARPRQTADSGSDRSGPRSRLSVTGATHAFPPEGRRRADVCAGPCWGQESLKRQHIPAGRTLRRKEGAGRKVGHMCPVPCHEVSNLRPMGFVASFG